MTSGITLAIVALIGVVWWQGSSLFGAIMTVSNQLLIIGEKLDAISRNSEATWSTVDDIAREVTMIRDPAPRYDRDPPA